MLAVRLPEALEMRLNALSLKTHRSKSFYIKKGHRRLNLTRLELG